MKGNSTVRIGFAELLTLLFIGLKLTDHIEWSWWWVLSPIWITFAIAFVIRFAQSAARTARSDDGKGGSKV